MSSIPPSMSRTSTLFRSDQVLSQLRRTQTQLGDVERQVATGLKYGRPSDGADKTPGILYIRQQLAAREQHGRNLDHARGMLDTTDSALREANNLLLDAKTGAMGQIGIGADADTRKAESLVVDSQLKAMIDLANQKYQGISLFGGTGGANPAGPAFTEFLGGVRYVGSTDNLTTDNGTAHDQPFTSNGLDAFGALSARVASLTDLQPQASADTAISDVAGATLQGVRLGNVRLTVNGSSADVDLRSADTLGDVTTRINDAITNLGGGGSLAIAGDGFELTAGGGNTIDIEEIGGGKTANDLGLELSATGATVAGPSVNRQISDRTQLADLDPAIDWAGGLLITHGEQSKVADFSSAQTVEDLKNVIQDLGLGLRMQANDAGTGLDLISEVSGISLSIGENGGTTAADLGLRTLGDDTRLSDFRHGHGVETVEGEDDLRFTLSDGTTFDVNLDGATTIAETIAAIDAQSGGQLTVDYEATGNGLVFTDNTGGAGDFTIAGLNQSQAANHLGIAQSVPAGDAIRSGDQAQVRVDSVFTHLIDLREALRLNDESGITVAGEKVEEDLNRLTQVRASVGVEGKRVEQEQERSQDRQLSEETMLSNLQDADMTEVITRYMQLQQQWQASLQVGAQNMQNSLLDYLR